MEFPDITFKHKDIQFDKDAQGAHEFSFEITQDGKYFVHNWESYDAWSDQTISGERPGEILNWFESDNLVKIQFEDGEIDFLDLSKENFVNDDFHSYSFFLIKEFEKNIQSITKPLIALMDDILTAVTNKIFNFTVQYEPGKKQLSDQHVKLDIFLDTDSKTPVLLKTNDSIHPFQIEIGVNLERYIPKDTKITNHGFIKAECLAKKHRVILNTLGEYMNINGIFEDYNGSGNIP